MVFINTQGYGGAFGLPFGFGAIVGRGLGVTDGTNGFGGNDALIGTATPWGVDAHTAGDRFIVDGANGNGGVAFSNGANLQVDANNHTNTYTASDGYQFKTSDKSGSKYPETDIYNPSGTEIGYVNGDPYLYSPDGKKLDTFHNDNGHYTLNVGDTTMGFDVTSPDSGSTYALNNVTYTNGDNHVAFNAAHPDQVGVGLDGGPAGFALNHAPNNGNDVYDPLSGKWYSNSNGTFTLL